jgi:hypothetical protein
MTRPAHDPTQPVVLLRQPARRLRSVACLLGSFDPLHRGHQFMVSELLRRHRAVALLVPGRHFSKRIRPGYNATLEQRLKLMQAVYRHQPRVYPGLANEVLFIELREHLARLFGARQVALGMGDETFRLLLDTRSYWERSGRAWGAAEQRRLERAVSQTVVFGRSGDRPGTVAVPPHLRRVSSTRVRALAARLHRLRAPAGTWRSILLPLVEAPVIEAVRCWPLYRLSPWTTASGEGASRTAAAPGPGRRAGSPAPAAAGAGASPARAGR